MLSFVFFFFPLKNHTINLRCSILDKQLPLTIQLFDDTGAEGSTIAYEHETLQCSTQKTRDLLAQALDKKYLEVRYGKKTWKAPFKARKDWRIYSHDVAIMFHPTFANIHYINVIVSKLGGSEQDAGRVKDKVFRSAVELVKRGLEEKRKGATASEAATRSGAVPSGGRQQVIRHFYQSKAQLRAKSMHHLLPPGAASASSTGGRGVEASLSGVRESTQQQDLQALAEGTVRLYQAEGYDPELLYEIELGDTCKWWKENGVKRFPALAEAAQAVFSLVAGSGVLELDFSPLTVLVDRARSTLDPRYAEMIHTVYAATSNGGLPFKDVPPLLLKPGEPLETYMPNRIVDEHVFSRLSQLSVEEEEGAADDDVVEEGWANEGINSFGSDAEED